MKCVVKNLIGMLLLFSNLSVATENETANLTINVFAIPSQPIIQLVNKTSDELQKLGMHSFFAQHIPVHATLYLTDFPPDAKALIKQRIEQIAQHYQAFAIEANGASITQGNWVFIDLDWNKTLQRLADDVTLSIEPLRITEPALPDWVKHYPTKLQAFKRYGSPNVFQNFEPHLTLLAAETDPKLADFAQHIQTHPPQASGQIIGIGIAVVDQWGQPQEVLARYLFQ